MAHPEEIKEVDATHKYVEVAVSHKSFVVMHKFSGDRKWENRGNLLVGYDKRGYILEAKINTLIPAADIFTQTCADGKLYQLRIPELDLMTSVDACQYSTHAGLNETLSINTIDSKEITGFFYEITDIEYLASRERQARRKRLMLTPDFTEWRTTVLI